MGADIWLYVERRRGDLWECVPPHQHQGWCNSGCLLCSRPCGQLEWYTERSYAVFGVLAGVRNIDDSEVIADPRGLPDDLSDTLQEAFIGANPQGWLLVSELLAHEWPDGTEAFQALIEELEQLGAEETRIVFGFEG